MKDDVRIIKCHVKSSIVKDHGTDYKFIQKSDVRSKRIEIVFKVIYVIAILGAYFLTLSLKYSSNDLTDSYILITCCTTFLFCVLIYMLIYIFNELKCLKICYNDLSKTQEEKTERSYSAIFEYFIQGGITILICYIIFGSSMFKNILTKDLLLKLVMVSTALTTAFSKPLVYGKKHIKFFSSINYIFCTVTVMCVLISMAFVEV